MNVLSGYKTYIIAAAMIIASGLHAQGYISADVYTWLQGILMGGGFATLRAAKAGQ